MISIAIGSSFVFEIAYGCLYVRVGSREVALSRKDGLVVG